MPKLSPEARFALVLIVPLILFNFGLIIYPLIYSLWLSFTDYNVFLGSPTFLGADNYSRALLDPAMHNAMYRSIGFSTLVTVMVTLLALPSALVLNERFKGNAVVSCLLLVPWCVSEYATAIIFKMFTLPTAGTINGILYSLGLVKEYVNWMDFDTAIYWVALAFSWHLAPLGTFFVLASLKAIPTQLYKACRIDGGGVFRRFRDVTFPYIRYALVLTIVLAALQAIRAFDAVYVMTKGGPGDATSVLTYYIFKESFINSNYGYGAALSYILLVISTMITVVYFYVLYGRRR